MPTCSGTGGRRIRLAAHLFRRAGDIVNDSAELSKPASLAGSTGNSRAGRMSTPVKSRIV